MVAAIASDPNRGDLVVGTGGCRKLRHAGHGKGKSGGYRTIHYNGADDVPVLLMVVINKRERSNLSASEKSELKQLLQRYEEEYRKGTRSAERRLRGRRLTDR